MEKDNLNILFKTLEGGFDIEEPTTNHQQRFLEKLNSSQKLVNSKSKLRPLFNSWIGIAASIVLLISIAFAYQGGDTSRDLSSVSPEMATTQDFFTNTISAELEKLQVEDSPEYQTMIVDALYQIELLEQNYEQLKQDLDVSGNDTRVIQAMISNFQNRIEILQNVLSSIDELKQLNNINNENSSTL